MDNGCGPGAGAGVMVAPEGMIIGEVKVCGTAGMVGMIGISGGGFVASPNDRVSPGILRILITFGARVGAATTTLLTGVSNGGVFLRA